MDQHHRVFWTDGFSAMTRLLRSSLTFALNLSYSSALSAYSSFDTLCALTFPLPSRSQPLLPPLPQRRARPHLCFSPTSAPWGGQPLQHPSSAEDASDGPSIPPSYKCKQSSFFSFHVLPRHFSAFPHHSMLSYVCNPTFPLCWVCARAAAPLGFLTPQSPDLMRHRRNNSMAAALQRHPRQLVMHERRGMSQQRRRGKSCPCALLFGISDVWRRAHITPWGRTPYFTPAALRKP